MSHPFHYFIPGQGMDSFAPNQKFGRTQLDAVGLGYLFDLLHAGATMQDAKVDGKSGVLFTPNAGGLPAQVTAYQPQTQTWITSGKTMIGWENSAPPTAEFLAKKTQVFGYTFQAAGSAWLVPLARSPSGRSNIPTDYKWDESGEPIPCHRADYEWLWDLAGEVWDYWHTDKGNELGETWLVKTALKILQVNYYIGPHELNAFRAMGLHILDQLNSAAISLALIDNEFPQEVASAKKNEAAIEAA